jgi:hypothetical protein
MSEWHDPMMINFVAVMLLFMRGLKFALHKAGAPFREQQFEVFRTLM